MNSTDIANALLFGIPFVTYAGLQHGLDGPDGLLAERMHEGIIAEARANGCRDCEVTRLAVADGVDSRNVLALLLSLSHLVARQVHEVTDVFIEVNPRHVAFYSRAL